MNRRTTKTDLYTALSRLNKTFGYDLSTATSENYMIPGSFVLQGAYGGWQLQQMCEGGGVRAITNGYRPKSEIVDYIHAMLKGIALLKDSVAQPT
jgi:hypothetical protein